MKKNYLIILVLLISGTLNSFAQDYIYLINGNKIAAQVSETTKTATLYTEFGEANGEMKLVDNKDIKLIAFANGKVKDFTNGSSVKSNDGASNNLIAYHLADLLINNFTISYERIFNNGRMGIQNPYPLDTVVIIRNWAIFETNFIQALILIFTQQGKANGDIS